MATPRRDSQLPSGSASGTSEGADRGSLADGAENPSSDSRATGQQHRSCRIITAGHSKGSGCHSDQWQHQEGMPQTPARWLSWGPRQTRPGPAWGRVPGGVSPASATLVTAPLTRRRRRGTQLYRLAFAFTGSLSARNPKNNANKMKLAVMMQAKLKIEIWTFVTRSLWRAATVPQVLARNPLQFAE